MRRPIKELIFPLIAILIVALDQVSKFFIKANMTLGQSIPDEGFFRITYSTNEGMVFGLFANQTFLITITAIIGIVAIIIYSRYHMFNNMLVKVALGLMLGGAVGNLIDRIRLGEVTDFLDVGAWPVFNMADSAVVVGVVLLILYLLFLRGKGAPKREEV